MLKKLHDSHQGVSKTKELAKQHVYWPGILSDVTNLVLTCPICNKYNRSNKRNELLNHEIPKIPFDKVGADIAHYGGKDYLVVVDYFSRSFAKEWGFQINNTSPNHPMSNGLSEKYVGLVKKMIKKCRETNDELEDYLLTYRNTPLVNVG
ncbi:Uncharacterized protein FWK35_00037704 [Aphis craccivora]|uniref:RNA-directed DNA polymerase n=1 Tax=Aphis craccivora TaxID=307492 RepID=A0A6G0VL54_APHCR|nr:Uncharacterized protein FWK35_00037704 [Aphis craccivora]